MGDGKRRGDEALEGEALEQRNKIDVGGRREDGRGAGGEGMCVGGAGLINENRVGLELPSPAGAGVVNL